MKNKLLPVLILLLCNLNSKAQVTGSDTVCAGFIYSYSVNIAGADSFAWNFPSGWAVISGAGNSLVQVLCTQNVGQVCVDGFDTSGNFIAQFCHPVSWGDGGGGWNLAVNSATACQCSPMLVSVVPNGMGGGCAGCGNGTPSPNIQFAIYDNPWPSGNYIGPANGVFALGIPFSPTMYYVYQVDMTFGINNAILIEGGLCSGSINNTFFLNGPCNYVNLGIIATPDPVCIGDTLLLAYDNVLSFLNSYAWGVNQGSVTFVSTNGNSSIQCIVNSAAQAQINLLCFDMFNCPYNGILNLNTQSCNAPTAAFTSVQNPICPGTCTGFTNLSTGAASYQWNFSGANPISDTASNPANICYNAPGSYDVQLIASSASGSDTLLLANYITVYPYPPPQGLHQAGDTLLSNTGFVSYQWYYNTVLIPGATDYFYVATQNGDYNLISVDSNGCEVEAAIFNVVVTPDLVVPIENGVLTVSPNPVKGMLKISPATSASEMEIYNVMGEKVLAHTRKYSFPVAGIDVSTFTPGIYFIELKNNNSTSRAKFIKE